MKHGKYPEESRADHIDYLLKKTDRIKMRDSAWNEISAGDVLENPELKYSRKIYLAEDNGGYGSFVFKGKRPGRFSMNQEELSKSKWVKVRA